MHFALRSSFPRISRTQFSGRHLETGSACGLCFVISGIRWISDARSSIIIAIAVFSQWSGNGLISYYSHLIFQGIGIENPRTQAALNGGLGVWNLICAMSGAMLVDKLGRRTLFLISNTGMLVVFCAWTITTALWSTMHYTAAAKATVPIIFLFYAFYDIAYTPLLIAYGLEILPYSLRAKGFTVLVRY